jgi:hypothetical protein
MTEQPSAAGQLACAKGHDVEKVVEWCGKTQPARSRRRCAGYPPLDPERLRQLAHADCRPSQVSPASQRPSPAGFRRGAIDCVI